MKTAFPVHRLYLGAGSNLCNGINRKLADPMGSQGGPGLETCIMNGLLCGKKILNLPLIFNSVVSVERVLFTADMDRRNVYNNQ